VRLRGNEAYVKDVNLRTGTWYKADGVDELAQHSEVWSSMPEVNHEVVHRNNVFLPREVSSPCIVRFQSTAKGDAALAAMSALCDEKSAEAGVVAMQSVSSRRRVTRPVKSAARCGGRRAEPKKGKQPEVNCE